MKHNHLTNAIGVTAFATIFISLFVIAYTLLDQIINFLITYQGTGLHLYR